ncbi:MAG: zf-HC2 domain-containing protein [Actinomycetota bacterium]
MSHDTSESWVPFLRGDLDRASSTEVTEHLRQCEQCRFDLVDIAEMHSSLTAIGRGMRHETPEKRALVSPLAAAVDLPPLRMHTRRSRVGASVLAASAAAVLFFGAGYGWNASRDSTSVPPVAGPNVTPSPEPVGRSVSLQPLTGSGAGQVSMANLDGPTITSMTISTKNLAAPEKDGFFYVWLLDPETKKMVPLGVLNPNGETRLDMNSKVIEKYHMVDISWQKANGNPAHSGDSVLRASY